MQIYGLLKFELQNYMNNKAKKNRKKKRLQGLNLDTKHRLIINVGKQKNKTKNKKNYMLSYTKIGHVGRRRRRRRRRC